MAALQRGYDHSELVLLLVVQVVSARTAILIRSLLDHEWLYCCCYLSCYIFILPLLLGPQYK